MSSPIRQQPKQLDKDILSKSSINTVRDETSSDQQIDDAQLQHDYDFIKSFQNNILEGIRNGRYETTEAALLDNGFIKLERSVDVAGAITNSYYDQQNSVIIRLTDRDWSSMKGLSSGGSAGICLHNKSLVLGIEVDNFVNKELIATNYSMLAHEFSHLSEYFNDRPVWNKDHLNAQAKIFMDRFVLRGEDIPISREMIRQVPNLDLIAHKLIFDQNNLLRTGPGSAASDYHLISELYAFTNNSSSNFPEVRKSGEIAKACKELVEIGVALKDRTIVKDALQAWHAQLTEYGHGYAEQISQVDFERATNLIMN